MNTEKRKCILFFRKMFL